MSYYPTMMQEPAHRPMSFRANSFSRFVQKHGISLESSPYDPYGLVDNATLKESKDFIVQVSKDDRVYSFAMTLPEYRTVLPPIEDVLEHLANDAAIMENFSDDPQAFAELINRPLSVAEAVIEQASSLAGPFKLFIGPEAYAEFLKITEVRS